MPSRRLAPPNESITLHVDGRPIRAQAGEPIAVALAAAGRWLLGRSVKYHRPRGPACFAGRCDGCLMRVDGIANVMTCRAFARDGMVVETQNVLGTADADLLAATDWFFPEGMNHHEMFTSNRWLNAAMQKVARRIAGVGELPVRLVPPTPPREVECDVLVIGGGLAGLVAATCAARTGAVTVLADEQPQVGGLLRIWPGPAVPVPVGGAPVAVNPDAGARASAAADDTPSPYAAVADVVAAAAVGTGPVAAEALEARARAAGVAVLVRHAVVGIYDDDVLLHAPDAVVRVRTRSVVLATGSHEGAAAFVGADLPGVLGARAAAVLLSFGVLPGDRIALVDAAAAPVSPAAAACRGGPASTWSDPRAQTAALLDGLAWRLENAGARVVVRRALREGDDVRCVGRTAVRALEFAEAVADAGPRGPAGFPVGSADAARRRHGEGARWDVDCVIVATPPSAAYELGEQAGAEVRFDGERFVLRADEGGATGVPWCFAAGEVCGRFERTAVVRQAAAAGLAASAAAAGAEEVPERRAE